MWYKKLFVILITSCSTGLQAHQADISATLFAEREEGQWILQVNASLTAFQQEIKLHYPEYTSRQEFKEMVIDHLRKNINVFINEKAIVLDNVQIRLGHQTYVVFEITDMPRTIEDVVIQNTSFSDIQDNQTLLTIFKQGFNRKHCTLDHDNDHTVWLEVDNNSFVLPSERTANPLTLLVLGIGLGILTIGAAKFYFRRQDKKLQLV